MKKEAMLRLHMDEGERITRYLANNIFFDTTHPASWGKAQVECAIEVSGADHILFGTSFPVFYNWMSDGVEFMKTLGLTDADRKAMGQTRFLQALPYLSNCVFGRLRARCAVCSCLRGAVGLVDVARRSSEKPSEP